MPADFELFVRPSFATRDSGFDRIRVVAPSRAAMLLARVDLGREIELSTTGMDDGYVRREDGALVSAAGQILTVSGQGTDSLFIELPRVQKRGGAEVLRLFYVDCISEWVDICR